MPFDATPIAVTGGSLLLVAVCVLVFFGVAAGWYTRRGSGISAHPSDGRGAAPGSDDTTPGVHDAGTR